MDILEIEHLTYSYPLANLPALQDASLNVQAGEIVFLLGANESGKSTLCFAACGLIPYHFNGTASGSVQVCGVDVLSSAHCSIAGKAGLVLQNPFNQMSGSCATVEEEIAFGLGNLGVPYAEMKTRVSETLARLDLQELAQRSPLELSGGQMQRVAIASMLALRPSLLVLDEPVSQLDGYSALSIMELLRELSRDGVAILVAEQNTVWAAEYADRVVVLHQGSILLEGSPASVFHSTAYPVEEITLPSSIDLFQNAHKQGLCTMEEKPVTYNQILQALRGQA